MFQFNRAFGMTMPMGTWVVILLPLLLGVGKLAVVAVTIVLCAEILVENRIFSHDEKEQFVATCRHYILRMKR
jgi:hypothetical protein